MILPAECNEILDMLAARRVVTEDGTPITLLVSDRFTDAEIDEMNRRLTGARLPAVVVAQRNYRPEDHVTSMLVTYNGATEPAPKWGFGDQPAKPTPAGLTVGMLRRLLDDASIDDDTPIVLEVHDPDDTLGGCDLAQRAYAQASDAVRTDLGGTDPQFEDTRAVLILTNEPGPGITVACAFCSLMLVPNDATGTGWAHEDGHDYRHPAQPAGVPRPWWARFARLTDEEREKVWAAFASRVPPVPDGQYEWVETIDGWDPTTWNPDSPLYLLMKMAAAGDLTPLADALHAARTPGAN